MEWEERGIFMTKSSTHLEIQENEFKSRLTNLREYLLELKVSGVILFDRDYILYYSGFAFIPTERPIALLMNLEGVSTLFVPRLELEHASMNSIVDEVSYYTEYPDQTHPMQELEKALRSMGIQETIAADDDGYPWIMGYRGPSLSQKMNAQVVPIRSFVEDHIMIKSSAEVDLIKESVRWGNLAHTLLQRYTAVGLTESEVSALASSEATSAMLDAIGPLYRAQNPFWSGASAVYRGQIGRNAAIPHALAANITFQSGDVLVTEATAPIWGYVSELERTMIVGDPTSEQRTLFKHMLNLQELAFDNIKPGTTCSEVDRAVRGYYEEHDLLPYWRHHTGHAIGIRYHEGPFLDIGDHTEIKPGMVFTVEPGLYVPNLGGFRHSDTVLVTEDGIEILTYYPRDLESLSISA
jgi:Xaa-Pro aminopeptidase